MNEKNVGPLASTLVMLAAIGTAFVSYSSYVEERSAISYGEEQAEFEQTANALVSLRMMQSDTDEAVPEGDAKALDTALEPELE